MIFKGKVKQRLAGAGRVGEALPVGLGAEVRVVGLVELV